MDFLLRATSLGTVRMLPRALILLLFLSVVACEAKDARKAASECEAVTLKALPNESSDPLRFDQQARYASACMRGRGLSVINGDARCAAVSVEGASIDASCFH